MFRNKHIKKIVVTILTLATVLASTSVIERNEIGEIRAAEPQLAAKITTKAPGDTYQATQLVNGGFSVEPWMNFIYNGKTYSSKPSSRLADHTTVSPVPNGVGGGWNTTENEIFSGNTLFEFLDAGTVRYFNSYLSHNSGYAVEMNANNSAALYQDLRTNSGDIIKWTLMHAVRYNYGATKQTMKVEIGGINGPASGINASINTNMVSNTKATYTSSGVTNGGATYGYANIPELAALDVSKTDTTTRNKWNQAAGVYVIPDGQATTRFAFISTITEAGLESGGNLLDDITFTTLLGHLEAKSYTNGNVKITGYWGETDPTKKLIVSLDGREYPIDMSNVAGGHDFEVEVPASIIGTADDAIVWHENYQLATKDVEILKYVNYGHDGLNNIKVTTAENEEITPTKRVSGPTTDPSNRANLVVNLTGEGDKLTLYKIADTTYSERTLSGVTIGEYKTTWDSSVLSWITTKADYNNGVYKDPLTFGKDTTENARVKFYKAMLSNEGNIITADSISPFTLGEEEQKDLSYTFGSDGKYVTEINNLPFGIYAIMAENGSGNSYAPLIVSIIPYENGPAGTYYVNYTYYASLKDASATLDKTINGEPSDTVAIGDKVSFNIEVSLPLTKAKVTLDQKGKETHPYKLYVEDDMSAAFVLNDNNTDGEIDVKDITVKYTYTEAGENKEGTFPIEPINYYVIGPEDCALDDGIDINLGNCTNYTYDSSPSSELNGKKAYLVSGRLYSGTIVSGGTYGVPSKAKIEFNVPAIKAWLKQDDTPSSINEVIISYDAIVTDKILVGSDANTNKVVLYTEADDPVNASVTAYTYAMNLTKINGETAQSETKEKLPGAKFKLYKETDLFVKKVNKSDPDDPETTYEWLGDIIGSDANTLKATVNDEEVVGTPLNLSSNASFYIYEETAPIDLSEEDSTVSTIMFKTVDGALVPLTLDHTNNSDLDGATLVHVYQLYSVEVKDISNTTRYEFSGAFETLDAEKAQTADEIGTYKVSGLNAGNYVLVETDAPIGYNDLAEDIMFSLNKLSKEEALSETYKSFRQIDGTLNKSGVLELTVLNFKGLTLPATGGTGTNVFIIIGGCLMCGVIIMALILRKKKQEEETE